ncbi:hypothetical protein ABKW33_17940 [Sanguibacter sp. 26GB23]
MTKERAVSGAGEATPADAVPGEPVPAVRPRRGNRRVVRKGTEHEVVAGPSSDEVSTGWSEGQDAAGDANDARLARDVPPHW